MEHTAARLLAASSLWSRLILWVHMESILDHGDALGASALKGTLCNSFEGLLYISVLLGTRLEVWYFVLIAPFLGLGFGNFTCLNHIALVSQDYERKLRRRLVVPGILEELPLPGIQGSERLGVGNIKDQDTAIRSSVECDTEGLETLLASGIPDLEGGELLLNADMFDEKISANGSFVLAAKLLVNVTVHQRGLSNTENNVGRR